MTFSTITLAQHGSVAVLTFNRADRRNAFNVKMMEEIVAACEDVGRSEDARTLVITGGPEVFSAGADLTEALKVTTADECARFFGSLRRLNSAVETLNKPVIAAIEGFCITGGCEFALACDLRIAGEGATFAITSSRIGTIAGCFVTEGKVTRGAKVRVVRDGTVIYETTVASLKRFNEDAREVASGFECGIVLASFQDVKEGDVLEVYETRKVERALA